MFLNEAQCVFKDGKRLFLVQRWLARDLESRD